ncbi:hypothetical protein MASR2M117_09060 [Paludibacter sp.]
MLPATHKSNIQLYIDVNYVYAIFWISFSYVLKRFKISTSENYIDNIKKLIWTTLSVQVIMTIPFVFSYDSNYSYLVLVGYSLAIFSLSSIYYIIQFTINSAIEYKDVVVVNNEKTEEKISVNEQIDTESKDILEDSIIEYSGNKAYNLISKHVNLDLKNNLISFSANYFDLKSKPNNYYSGIVFLNKLNNIRGINRLFSTANQKTPLNGTLICCFEELNMRKKRIFRKYPIVINYAIYFFEYIFRRVIPKILLTKTLYFNLTKGKDRILSKTEVLGRLVYCGFDIVSENNIAGLTYVIATKARKLEAILEDKHYGSLLKLRRLGKNGKLINVYKFRTMYSYAEYLQAYIYKLNSLQKGGKFKKDFRINSMGRFMRKYWIDELPMFINLIRGEMKLVGVRPLSQQYFSLYSKELQKLRIKYKPGLLPPFYADLPETLDEIQESELRYLKSCQQNGVFITDLKYFVLILKNILFKKAKSA